MWSTEAAHLPSPVTALQRARHQRKYGDHEEVERLLFAAMNVILRVAPEAPRVSDIVAEAGSSNKSFYRYFAGKDDLVQAVIERGTSIVARQLAEQMAKESEPANQVRRWIEELLAKVAHPHMMMLCNATIAQMSARAGDTPPHDVLLEPLRALLTEPIQRMGRAQPEHDADAVFTCTIGTLQAWVGARRPPPPEDIAHLVGFCLGGLGVQV